MESMIHGSDRRASMFSDKVLLPTDALTEEVLTIFDLKNTCHHWEPLLIPSPEIAENQRLMEPGFHGNPRTTSADKPIGYPLGSKISDGRTVTSISCLFGQEELFREEELGSKDSSSIIGTGSQNSSFIDLKHGRLTDLKNVKNDKCPEDTESSLSAPSTPPAKKIRSTGLNCRIPYCQVHGCNIDLSSSKDYHKKHKVCEIHSKTAKVIVNGIEQRFCQQCSRFHLLAEFDDGKRSCRRRLAGHNERRRKLQLDIHSGRSGRLLQSYYGGGFLEASLPVRTSFLSTETYPGGILHELEHENPDWCWHVKEVDDDFPGDIQTPMSTINGVRESICAPSLLSSQSQNTSGYSSAIPMFHPATFPDGQAQNSVTQVSDKPLPVISQASPTVTSNRFSSGMDSGEYEQKGLLVSDASNAVNFQFRNGSVYQGSQFMNTREPFSPERGNTVNLIQLSSLLQRAAEQRMSVQAKQEYEVLNLPSHHTSAVMAKCAMACCL